jgi:hypothetical protein
MFSGMPGSSEAALVFALLIVPGYQIVRGYAVARGADAPPKDLYVLAQTIVASLVWLVLTRVAVEDLLRGSPTTLSGSTRSPHTRSLRSSWASRTRSAGSAGSSRAAPPPAATI